MSHYKSTVIEIWQQMNGEIDYIAGAIRTSGTLMGPTNILKVMNPDRPEKYLSATMTVLYEFPY